MESINATDFRKQAFSVLEAVRQGTSYSISLKGVEVAVLSPPRNKPFPLGMLAGKGWIASDFNDEITGLEDES